MRCPICHNGLCAPVFRNDVFATPRNVMVCGACRVYFLDPVPGKDELDAYYRSHYTNIRFHYPLMSPQGYMKIFYANMRAKSQWRYVTRRIMLPREAKVVELGSATGNLLHLFQKQGARTTGVELGASSSRYAFDRYGLRVINADIDTALDGLSNDIDLILMSHTLEHLPHPAEILAKCSRVLNKGGALFVELPNSYLGPPEGPTWLEFASVLLNSDHMFNYSPYNMEILLRRCGFRLLDATRFQAQQTAPWLARRGIGPQVNAVLRKDRGLLTTYGPLLLNTVYLAGKHFHDQETIAELPPDRSWSGTDEWIRFIAVRCEES